MLDFLVSEAEWAEADAFFAKPANSTAVKYARKLESRTFAGKKHSFIRFPDGEILAIHLIIDKGSQGIVRLAKNKLGKFYAVKVEICEQTSNTQSRYIAGRISGLINNSVFRPLTQADISQKYHGRALTAPGKRYIKMPYFTDNSLDHFLAKYPQDECYDDPFFIIRLLSKVARLHRLNIMHGDLKPGNVMLEKDNSDFLNPILVDFSLAKLIPQGQQFLEADPEGTPGYIAPEVLQVTARYSTAADVFSLGMACVMDFGLLGVKPKAFLDSKFKSSPWFLLRNKPYELLQKEFGLDGASPILRMLHPEPEKRITLPEVIDTLKTKLTAQRLDALEAVLEKEEAEFAQILASYQNEASDTLYRSKVRQIMAWADEPLILVTDPYVITAKQCVVQLAIYHLQQERERLEHVPLRSDHPFQAYFQSHFSCTLAEFKAAFQSACSKLFMQEYSRRFCFCFSYNTAELNLFMDQVCQYDHVEPQQYCLQVALLLQSLETGNTSKYTQALHTQLKAALKSDSLAPLFELAACYSQYQRDIEQSAANYEEAIYQRRILTR